MSMPMAAHNYNQNHIAKAAGWNANSTGFRSRHWQARD